MPDIVRHTYYHVTIQNVQQKVFLAVDKDGTGKNEHYICKTCKDSFLSNKMPSRCILNECRTAYQPDSLKNMTEVEASLISQNLQFQKLYRMPRSQWAQTRDRVINVPVPTISIKNTIKNLPRNLSESGLLGVRWKRKKSYKNTHKTQLVDINRVFNGLEYLIDHNPLYKDSNINKDFLDTCKLNDPSGHDFFLDQNNNLETINSEDDELFQNINSQNQQNTEHSTNSSEPDNEIDKQDKDYNEYAKTDPIRSFQFDYDEHVALANEIPTAQLDGNTLTKKNPTQNNNNLLM